jgi:hypothetical protein
MWGFAACALQGSGIFEYVKQAAWLLYAAKVKIEHGKLDIEYVGMEPIRLPNLKKY